MFDISIAFLYNTTIMAPVEMEYYDLVCIPAHMLLTLSNTARRRRRG